jgi:uncharacterized protein (TIGR02453 family)
LSTSFSPATWAFLHDLAADNTRSAFDAHRDTYQREVAEPSAALVQRLAGVLADRVHPDLRGEAKIGRSLFRINRDTRFSRDKKPYKTHLDFLFWIGDGPPREQPACIMRLTSTTALIGAGQMGVSGGARDRYRHRLDDPADGASLRDIVTALQADGAELSEPDRARPPKPYPQDHPNAELLRRDGFHVTATLSHPAEINAAGFAGWCATQLAAYRPLLDWLTAG